MAIQLTPDTEILIAHAVAQGVSPSPTALVESAVREYLESRQQKIPGRFRELRRKIEESGVALLDEAGLKQEIAERRGSWE